jgi:ABC-2 type transport system permease protein
VSSVVSARLLYPVAKPGDSPFKAPQGAAMATMFAQLITMGVLVVLCLPAAGLALANVLTGAMVWGWLALVVGVGLGVVFLVVGMRWGGRLVDQRGPELLQQVMSYK